MEVTKHRCDKCSKEVEDVYLTPGWIQFQGQVVRSWGTRTGGKSGNAQTDFIDKNSEFCSIECFVAELDEIRRKRGGPPATPEPKKPAGSQKPWEDPFPDDEDLLTFDGDQA
jgi:hypothetical protein